MLLVSILTNIDWIPCGSLGRGQKIVLPSMKQDLQQVNGIYKNIFYFWSGPRSFEVTLIPPDRESHNPSCCKENLSKMATWKSTAKFPPASLWTRLQAINLFCKGFPTKCLKIIFSKGKKKVNCFIVFSIKSRNQTFHFRLGSISVKKFSVPTHIFTKQ